MVMTAFLEARHHLEVVVEQPPVTLLHSMLKMEVVAAVAAC
jgi:hypothetical protein